MQCAMKPTSPISDGSATQLSTDAVKTVVLAAISCILYLRCLLPEDHFVPMAYDNVAIKVLRPKSSEASALLYDMLDNGVFDAIERQYLHKLTIAIIQSAERRDESLESYHLTFSYPQSGTLSADAELCCKDQVQSHKLGHFDTSTNMASQKVLAQQVHGFMRALVMVLQTLQTLPINCYLDMHLEYNDSTPSDYEPMFFRASDIVPRLCLPLKQSTSFSVVNTPCHSVKLNFETTSGGLVRESTQPLSSPVRKDVVHHVTACAGKPGLQSNPDLSTGRQEMFPTAPNSDDTILDDLEYEGGQHIRTTCGGGSLQPCETSTTHRASHTIAQQGDSPTQSQWSQSKYQGHATAMPEDDSPTQLDTPTASTLLSAVTHPPPPPTVISLLNTSSDDTAAPNSTTVDCLCQLNDSDGGMLQCEACHAWMHVVCYGYLYVKDPRLPERFLCAKCDMKEDRGSKFAAVSGEALCELGLFRSAVSVIWNEVPASSKKATSGKNKPKASSGSQQNKGDPGHVWRDTELAARLFTSVPQANALLSRAVDERIASWHARGKIAKRSQMLVLVHKQSNDARRALHVLFNPNLVALPTRRQGALLALESTFAPPLVTPAHGKPHGVTRKEPTGGAREHGTTTSAAVHQHQGPTVMSPPPSQQSVGPVVLSQLSSQPGSQTQLDSFPLSSLSHRYPSAAHSQAPPTTAGTVIPASMTPPTLQSQGLAYATRSTPVSQVNSVCAAPVHQLASSLDLLRVTNPHPAPPSTTLVLMSRPSTSVGAPAFPGTVFDATSTCSSLYQVHHARTAMPGQPPQVGSGGDLDSSGTLKWMPDSQLQTLTDGSLAMAGSSAAGAGFSVQRLPPPPSGASVGSPVAAVGSGQQGSDGDRPKVYRPMKRKYAASLGGQGDQDRDFENKKVKRSAAVQPARMPTP